jgi:hypothetical protein
MMQYYDLNQIDEFDHQTIWRTCLSLMFYIVIQIILFYFTSYTAIFFAMKVFLMKIDDYLHEILKTILT